MTQHHIPYFDFTTSKNLTTGNIEELGQTILHPLYPEHEFSSIILEEIHQMYCSRDVTYAISRLLKEQLYHKHMKANHPNLFKPVHSHIFIGL